MPTLRSTAAAVTVFLLAGCAAEQAPPPPMPGPWTFSPGMIFPADGSLLRPEDGAALPDGRIVVGDQAHGLRLVAPDGGSRPFGRFADAGYRHEPPAVVGGPNGVSLAPGGAYLIVTDVFRGGIYRVDVATEATELVYQHPFGVNSAVADRAGGIWFTQSTRNPPEGGEAALFSTVDRPTPDGAAFYLPPATPGAARTPRLLVDSLVFANGIALDEDRGHLYVAETMGGRLLRFRADVSGGGVSERAVVREGIHPDNLELDEHGRVWFPDPLRSEVLVFDPATDSLHSVFRIASPETEEVLTRIAGRLERGESWLELWTPVLWSPAPGLITGLILTPGNGPVYLATLGNALIRLDR